MPRNPENLEAPNRSELYPSKQPSQETVRKLGATAVKGAQRKR